MAQHLESLNWSRAKVGRASPLCVQLCGQMVQQFRNNFSQCKIVLISQSIVHNIERFRKSREISGKELKLTLNACKHRSLRWHCIKTIFFLYWIFLYGFWSTSENHYHLTEFKMSPTSLGLTQSGKVCCGLMCPYFELFFHFF